VTDRGGEGKSVAGVPHCQYAVSGNEGELVAGEIVFTPTEQDYVAANRAYLRRNIRRRLPLAVAVATLTIYMLQSLSLGGFAPWTSLVASIGIGIVIALAMWFGPELILARAAARLFRQQRTLHNEFQYRWSDEGLAHESPNGQGRIAWKDMYRWHDGETVFLFLLNARLYLFLPHRALSATEREDLRATATEFGPPLV
jgi:hypothetical protein